MDEPRPDDAELDACDINMAEHAVSDDNAAIIMMFAGVPDDEIADLADWYREGAKSDA